MLTQTYHYSQIIKKTVAIFGNLFNNITVGRVAEDGTISNVERVPIAYGPRQKFLDRITQQPDLTTDKVAIKLPRLSFEITSIQYDPEIKLNRLNRTLTPKTGDEKNYSSRWQAVPYLLGMQLNIYGRNQDDVLQVLEQVLPEFQPEYTVRVQDMEAPGKITDMPITLNSVTITDDYDGAFQNRRAIIYTLDFVIRIRFTGPASTQGMIRFVEVGLHPSMDTSNRTGEYVHIQPGSPQDTQANYTTLTTIDTFGFDAGFEFPVQPNRKADSNVITADNTAISTDTV
jgi:hypothetical protein